jgi:Uma2 family endonuclease
MNAPLPPSVSRRFLSVADYHRMGEAGVFGRDERVELIEGELIAMAPIGGPHVHAVIVLAQQLALALGDKAWVSTQNPVALSECSEPQPDIAILKRDKLRQAVPIAADVELIVEVADTSLAYDLDVKVPIYARCGIPEVWIVDVNARLLRVFRSPGEGGYREATARGADAAITPLAFPNARIALADLLIS